MKWFIAILMTAVLTAVCLAQDKVYEPTWESLDTRPTPAWYADAKFGIFIHHGLYSVPAWSPRGTYSEWYWHAKDGTPGENAARVDRANRVNEFHNRVYGADFEYKDFREMFTCEMFDASQWARIFKRSGARYVVLTSKHHDGYCLWPNKEASESFGMAWNSVDSGPGRDIVGELTEAVRAEGLKMGLYYSIWDWFNPYWPEEHQRTEDKQGKDKYIAKVMAPQFKELVTRYRPSLIFADGDWWMSDDDWKTRPLLAWLFNHGPNRDEVVINDRWGKVRGLHGGYFTTEYGSGFDDPLILWEENRGIGKSFGYNREETYDDYNPEQLLILMLVDIVSRGGNFLLDVGPTADGRIPVIMEDRLARMGAWMDVNGEAIYGTRRWVRDCQWSDGERVVYTKEDFHKGVPDPILEMSVQPRPGQAVKECYFTAKGETVYAMLPLWPDDGRFVVRDIRVGAGAKVTLLGAEDTLGFMKKGDGVEVDLSKVNPTKLPSGVVYVLKIEGTLD
ncbi:MAG: alpha-L-fucosidase [Planctomycetota bacterium]|jgi:alpha-L-fucosidase